MRTQTPFISERCLLPPLIPVMRSPEALKFRPKTAAHFCPHANSSATPRSFMRTLKIDYIYPFESFQGFRMKENPGKKGPQIRSRPAMGASKQTQSFSLLLFPPLFARMSFLSYFSPPTVSIPRNLRPPYRNAIPSKTFRCMPQSWRRPPISF